MMILCLGQALNRVALLALVVLIVGACGDFSHEVEGPPSDSPAEYYWNLYRSQSSVDPNQLSSTAGVPLKIVAIDANNWPVQFIGVAVEEPNGSNGSNQTDAYGTALVQGFADRSTVSLEMNSSRLNVRQIITSVKAPSGTWLFRASDHPGGVDFSSFRWPEGVFAKLQVYNDPPCSLSAIRVNGEALGGWIFDFGSYRDGLPDETQRLCRNDRQSNGKFSVIAVSRRVAEPNDIVSHAVALDFAGGTDMSLSLRPTLTQLDWRVASDQPAQGVKVYGIRKARSYQVFSWNSEEGAMSGAGGLISDFPAEQYWAIAQTYRKNSSASGDQTKLESIQQQSLDTFGLLVDFPRFGLMQPTLREASPRDLELQLVGVDKPDVLVLHMARSGTDENGNVITNPVEWTVYLPPDSTNVTLPWVTVPTESGKLDKTFFPVKAYLEAIDAESASGYDDFMNRLHANGREDAPLAFKNFGRAFKRETVQVTLVPKDSVPAN